MMDSLRRKAQPSMAAVYLGGLPGIRTKDGVKGRLRLSDEGLEFEDERKRDDILIPFGSIVSAQVLRLQAGLTQAYFESADASIARLTYTPVLQVTCLADDGIGDDRRFAGTASPRFYVTEGAGSLTRLTAPGIAAQATNAQRLLDLLMERQLDFYDDDTDDEDGDSAGDGKSLDIPAAIRELGRLRDDGLLTPQEFDEKKRELLARL